MSLVAPPPERLRPLPFVPRGAGLRRLERCVSPHLGIVNDLYELMRAPDDARLIRYTCAAASSSRLLGVPLDHLDGASGGLAFDRDAARAAAVGELVERYSASWMPPATLSARWDDLEVPAVDPDTFPRYDGDRYAQPGFPYRPFTHTTRTRWQWGLRLPGGEPALVPCQFTLLGQERSAREPRLVELTSNGLACGQSLEEAILAGLLEVIERDAFMLVWNGRLSLPLVDWRRDPALVALHERYYAPARVGYGAVDLSAVWRVPTVVAVVHGAPGDGAALALGAGCGASLAEAWTKALNEAFTVRVWVRALRRYGAWFGQAPEDVVTFERHVRYHADEENAAADAFLTASPARVDPADVLPLEGETPLDQIHAICSRLAEHGFAAFASDLTAPDVRAAGLRVARALVPGLIPINVDHGLGVVGRDRLRAGPLAHGLVDRVLDDADLNPNPHPFP